MFNIRVSAGLLFAGLEFQFKRRIALVRAWKIALDKANAYSPHAKHRSQRAQKTVNSHDVERSYDDPSFIQEVDQDDPWFRFSRGLSATTNMGSNPAGHGADDRTEKLVHTGSSRSNHYGHVRSHRRGRVQWTTSGLLTWQPSL